MKASPPQQLSRPLPSQLIFDVDMRLCSSVVTSDSPIRCATCISCYGDSTPARAPFLSYLNSFSPLCLKVNELTSKFSLERITKSPAVFDKVKLNWMNARHLKEVAPEQVGAHTKGFHTT